MTALLFERPLYLIPVLVVVLFILLRVWARRRSAGTRRVVWIGLVVAPLLILLQAVVLTDRERLVAVCHAMARAVEDGDVPAIAVHLADHFDTDGISKGEFLSGATRTLTRVHVKDARLRGFTITFDNSRHAGVSFTATAQVLLPDEIVYRQVSGWVLRFERISGVWQVVRINPATKPGFPFRRLRDVLHP